MLALTVERYAAVTCLLIGLSHVLHPQMWCDFFVQLAKANVAAIVITMYTLPPGLVMVLTHNDWTWRPTILVTILGWGQLTKSVIYCLAPAIAHKKCMQVEHQATGMRIAGFVLIAIAVPIALASFT